jgi:hypothetical protein
MQQIADQVAYAHLGLDEAALLLLQSARRQYHETLGWAFHYPLLVVHDMMYTLPEITLWIIQPHASSSTKLKDKFILRYCSRFSISQRQPVQQLFLGMEVKSSDKTIKLHYLTSTSRSQ